MDRKKIGGFFFIISIFIIISIIWILIGNFFLSHKNIKVENGGNMIKKLTANLMVKSVNESAEYYKKYFDFETVGTVPDSG